MEVCRTTTRGVAGWLRLAVGNGVAAREVRSTRRTNHRVLQVRGHVSLSNDVAGRFLILQRILLDGAVDLPQVVDAGILLRRRARFHEVGDRDRGEQPNDGHHDHDFNQREALLPVCSCFHN